MSPLQPAPHGDAAETVLVVDEVPVPRAVEDDERAQHLRVLKSAGLVNDERKGYWIYYSLNKEALEMCRQRLNRLCSCGCQGGNAAGKK
jgi:hypothetical protein